MTSEGRMPEEWLLGVMCRLPKNGDSLACSVTEQLRSSMWLTNYFLLSYIKDYCL